MSDIEVTVIIGNVNLRVVQQFMDSLAEEVDPAAILMARVIRVPLAECFESGERDRTEWCLEHNINPGNVTRAFISGEEYDKVLDLPLFIFRGDNPEFWPELHRLSVVRLDDDGNPWLDEA